METTVKSRLDAFSQAGPVERQAVVPLGSSAAMAPVGAQNVACYRDEEKIMEKLKVMAAVAGDEWFYRFPVRSKDGTVSYIEGPSIKLAMYLSRVFGNCDVDCRVQDFGDEWMIYARFSDFETGFTTTRPFQQRKSQKTMGKDDDRQRDIALQIGASKAIRNVVVNALRDLADFGFEEAKKSLVERIGKQLPQWRQKVMDRLAEEKVELSRAERLLGRAVGEWTAPDVARIIAIGKAVGDGMTTWTDALPEAEKAAPAKGEPAKEEKVDAETGEIKDEAEAKEAAGEDEGAASSEATEEWKRGVADRRRGVGYRVVPKNYTGAAADDWRAGWQAEDRAIHEGDTGTDLPE